MIWAGGAAAAETWSMNCGRVISQAVTTVEPVERKAAMIAAVSPVTATRPAQRNLFNRFLGCLYHCLRTHRPYAEDRALSDHRSTCQGRAA